MALAQKELEEVSSQIASIEEDLDEYQKIIEAIDTDLDIKLEDL
jgi:prefoldin subunit 5